ncbi:hypothetical protein Tco_0129086 [Tanacetum coccineum]
MEKYYESIRRTISDGEHGLRCYYWEEPRGIPKDIYSLINHYTDAKDIWENVKMILEGSELTKDDRESQLYDEFEHFQSIQGEKHSRINLFGEQVTNVEDDVDDSQENDLALNVDHIFEADECDAFDSDVDEGPTSQTMFMANLTSEDPIYDEAGPSYDSNNPFEVQDHDACVELLWMSIMMIHEMLKRICTTNYVVALMLDSYDSDSNIIPYIMISYCGQTTAKNMFVQCNALMYEMTALMSILMKKCIKQGLTK